MNGRYCILCCTVLCCGIVSFVYGSSCCESCCGVLWRDEDVVEGEIAKLISQNNINDKTEWSHGDKLTMYDAEEVKKEYPDGFLCVLEGHRLEDDKLREYKFVLPYNIDFDYIWHYIKGGFIANGIGISENDRLLLFVQGKIDNVVGGSKFGFDDKISDVFEQYKNKTNGILYISYALVRGNISWKI
ncbi:MAG: hypothetical protein II393_01115 [Cytophagales bacterium]|nr:hypothetical protein [Cytophagales bacterium]